MPDEKPSETDLILNLGNPDAAAAAPAKHIDPRWSKQYQGLKDFRDYLIDQLDRHQTEAREDRPDDIQDKPGEGDTSNLMRDYLLGMSSTEQETLYEVDDALRRIEDGTYGICERTGQPIPAERLKAVPWARFTVEAQAQAEHENQAAVHASIGELHDQAVPSDLPADAEAGREVGGKMPPAGTEKPSSLGRE